MKVARATPFFRTVKSCVLQPSLVPLTVLSGVYGFDKWHVAPLSSRPYGVRLVEYVNALTPRRSIVDVGCGTGDVLRRANYERRLGLDRDEAVLKAARLLATFQDVEYRKFVWPEPLIETWDVILFVNWIHSVEPGPLKRTIDAYANQLNPGGELIVDTVTSKDYWYQHSIERLAEGLSYREIGGGFAGGRTLYAICASNVPSVAN